MEETEGKKGKKIYNKDGDGRRMEEGRKRGREEGRKGGGRERGKE